MPHAAFGVFVTVAATLFQEMGLYCLPHTTFPVFGNCCGYRLFQEVGIINEMPHPLNFARNSFVTGLLNSGKWASTALPHTAFGVFGYRLLLEMGIINHNATPAEFREKRVCDQGLLYSGKRASSSFPRKAFQVCSHTQSD